MNLRTGFAFAYFPVKELFTAVAKIFAISVFLLIFAFTAFLFRFRNGLPLAYAFRYALFTPRFLDSSLSNAASCCESSSDAALFSSAVFLLFNCFWSFSLSVAALLMNTSFGLVLNIPLPCSCSIMARISSSSFTLFASALVAMFFTSTFRDFEKA